MTLTSGENLKLHDIHMATVRPDPRVEPAPPVPKFNVKTQSVYLGSVELFDSEVWARTPEEVQDFILGDDK